MQRIQNFIYWACVTSEVSHIFCCGLPIIFSLMSLMSSVGMVAVMPSGLMFLHDALHGYEIPMIITSGVIMLMGWGLHYIAHRMDCHSTGCQHGPCAPKKKRSGKVLMIASVLFVINLVSYFWLHS